MTVSAKSSRAARRRASASAKLWVAARTKGSCFLATQKGRSIPADTEKKSAPPTGSRSASTNLKVYPTPKEKSGNLRARARSAFLPAASTAS